MKNLVVVWFWENSEFLWKIPVLLVEVRKKDFEMKIVFWPLISYKISLLKFYNLRAFCKILQIIAISILKQNDPKSQKSRDNTSLVWSTYDIFRIGDWSEVALKVLEKYLSRVYAWHFWMKMSFQNQRRVLPLKPIRAEILSSDDLPSHILYHV